MSEYTYNDDVADLLHATQAKWWEERQQMIMIIADKDENIAELTKRLASVRTELNRLENEHAHGL